MATPILSPETPDLTTWLTKPEAARALGVSVRTVETLAATGKIGSAGRPQPGCRPAAVYHPGDIARVRAERQPVSYAVPVPAAPGSAEPPAVALARREYADDLEAFARFAQSIARPTEPPPLFVTVREAAAVTGLTQRYIRELVEKGKLEGIQDGRRLRIRRRDLGEL